MDIFPSLKVTNLQMYFKYKLGNFHIKIQAYMVRVCHI